ncbi:MAG: acyl-CoA thioesterase II [Bacteroidetes bacterium MedPE-SWsnd-G2]|nr:MAG: acyl-CoA thioesterase II [Bacteroidetes bacterium MedPE-SWsnd-G2]
MKTVDHLLKNLILDQVGEQLYNGVSKSIGSPIVFGGQVIAQSLNAAYRSITNGRILHSMHAYFLEAGQLDLPITYKVSIMREGGSFSTRRVTALQGEKVIFILAASFHKKESGYDHQDPMPIKVKQPEELLSWDDMLEQMGDFMPKQFKTFLEIDRPIMFKPSRINNPLEQEDLPPNLDVWFKLKGDTSEINYETCQQILAYVSDYNVLTTALNPHASEANYGNMQMASLDHSMWFFRAFDLNDWMLFSIESPSASNARGFTRGHIYTRDGHLIASVCQEGLMRKRK